MAENEKHNHEEHENENTLQPVELDAAGKSLSQALGLSFAILKLIMIVLVITFLASGFKKVEFQEKALVLRFGKIRGIGDNRVLEPGLKWILPYPIDEIVKIPVEEKTTLAVNSFWYKLSRGDIVGEGPIERNTIPSKLNPIDDGYCLTRSQGRISQTINVEGSEYYFDPELEVVPIQSGVQINIGGVMYGPVIGVGTNNDHSSDYNIVHTKWQITYHIDNIESFYVNVYVKDVKPGQVYFDVIKESIEPLLMSTFESAVVNTMVHFTIEDVITDKVATVTNQVKKLFQEKLTSLETGIIIDQVQLVDKTWPQQVNDAFRGSFRAKQDADTLKTAARTSADETLIQVGGMIAKELYDALMDPNATEEHREMLWSLVEGEARQVIDDAKAYKIEVVNKAKARSDYFKQILPEYRKNPKLVLEQAYIDTVKQVLQNVGETYIVEPTENGEIRIQVYRNPNYKKEILNKQDQTEQ